MDILKVTNQVAAENTYLIVNHQAVLVVDPGSDQEKILEKLEQIGKPVAAILLTHTHYDHIMGVEAVRAAYEHPPVYVSDKEASWLYTPVHNLSGLPRHDDMADVVVQAAEFTFSYAQPYDLADFHFRVVETPGHSAGGVSFIFPEAKAVITGDALFKGSIGRTDLPTGDLDTLLEGIRQNLFTLPDDYTVHPGHGMNTSIGQEKATNPYF